MSDENGDEIEVVIEGDGVEVEVPQEEAPPEPTPEPTPEPVEKPAAPRAEIPDDEYSEAVKKRIERERRVTQRERERADAEFAARLAAEARAAAAEAMLKEKSAPQTGDRIKELKEKLAQANLDADFATAADLSAELAEEVARQRAPQPKVQPQPQPQRQRPAETIPLADKWVKDNPWMTDVVKDENGRVVRHNNLVQYQAVLQLEKELLEEGYSPHEEDYYKTLNKRLAERVVIPKPRQTPTTPTAPTGGVAPGQKNKVILTKDDLKLIQKLGMDPSDPKVLSQYAKQKMSA